jgi:2-isopropylmalate synthase
MKYKLRMSEQQVVDNAVNAVKHLRSLGCTDIEFSPEDAGGCWLAGGCATWC